MDQMEVNRNWSQTITDACKAIDLFLIVHFSEGSIRDLNSDMEPS